jgi:predicted nucleotidyltransferase
MGTADMESRLRELLLEENDRLIAVYLYGSVARGSAGSTSDVDLGLLYRVVPPRGFDALPLRLEGRLEQALGRPVQAVLLQHAAPDLIHRVLRDGRLVVDRAPELRIQFEVWARNQYFDLLPHLARYRRVGAA